MEDLKRTIGKRAPDGAWEIPIVGPIGDWGGTKGEDLIRELSYVKPKTVRFVVYSPGGAVYDAIAVVGYMTANGIESYTEIFGFCASAATVFAAHSGPKNTVIAPGSMFLVHMPFGGDQKAIDNAVEYLLDLYTKSYGWSRSEARKHMQANEGRGLLWSAKEAKALGVVSEIMEGAKVAAHFNSDIMSEQVETVTEVAEKEEVKAETSAPEVKAEEPTKAVLKLTVAEALKATTGGLEITEDVVSRAIASETKARKDAEVLAAERGDLLTAAKAELEKAKTEIDATKALLVKANEEIADMKKPKGEVPKEDNQDAAIGRIPGTDADVPEHVKALRKLRAGATPLEIAEHGKKEKK